tara:strand:- start:2652 stop:2894 length:243 start_codon:yes stop_codon:yes gene_type:complete
MKKPPTSIEEVLEKAKSNGFDYRELAIYAKRIIHVNDNIEPLYAYQLAYEEHDQRKALTSLGYSAIHARTLAGSIRYGIY